MSDSNIETEGTPAGDADTPGQEQPVQPAADEESITDLLTEPLTQAYVKAIVALYALLGAGMGLLVIFYDIIDESVFDISGTGDGATFAFVGVPTSGAPHIAAVLALVVGGYLAVRMAADDKQTMITGAAGALAGTFLLWFLSSVLAASQLDDTSVEFGSLFINGIVLGLLVGGIAAGTVYIMRNLVPDVQEPSA